MAEATSVLVTGATGNQGGAVAKHLLSRQENFEVYGLTRDPESQAAQALSGRGATMVQGDLDDPDSYRQHVASVDAVFGVSNFWVYGYDRQVQHMRDLADVAAREGVNHFVFSGVGSHDQNTGIPHFDSCQEIDDHLQTLDLPTTVVKPVFFFHNFEMFVEDILGGTLAQPLEEGTSLQMVDVDDVGRVAAVAFANRDAFAGERYDLAGDEKTLSEMAETFSTVTGVDIEPLHLSIQDARENFGEEAAVMYEWFNEEGYSADIGALEETFGVEFQDLKGYLREHDWEEKSEPSRLPGMAKG